MSPLTLTPEVRQTWRAHCLADFESRFFAIVGSGVEVKPFDRSYAAALECGANSAYLFACFLIAGSFAANAQDSEPWWVRAIQLLWPGGEESRQHQALHEAFARQVDACLPLVSLDPEPDLLQQFGVSLCQFDGPACFTRDDRVQVPLQSVADRPFDGKSIIDGPLKTSRWVCGQEGALAQLTGSWEEVADALQNELPSLFSADQQVVALHPLIARYSLAVFGRGSMGLGARKHIDFLDGRRHQWSEQTDAKAADPVVGGFQVKWGWHFRPDTRFELLLQPGFVIREAFLGRDQAVNLEGCECFVSWRISQEVKIDQPLRAEFLLGALSVGSDLVSCRVTVPVSVQVNSVSRVGGALPIAIEPNCGEVAFSLIAQIDPESRRLVISWRLCHDDLYLKWTIRKPLCGDFTGRTLLAAAQDQQSWSGSKHG